MSLLRERVSRHNNGTDIKWIMCQGASHNARRHSLPRHVDVSRPTLSGHDWSASRRWREGRRREGWLPERWVGRSARCAGARARFRLRCACVRFVRACAPAAAAAPLPPPCDRKRGSEQPVWEIFLPSFLNPGLGKSYLFQQASSLFKRSSTVWGILQLWVQVTVFLHVATTIIYTPCGGWKSSVVQATSPKELARKQSPNRWIQLISASSTSSFL